MPKKHVIRDPEASYHVSVRCNNKDWFALPICEVWDIFERYLFFLHAGFCIEIQGFVLMNNHFHLLLRAPLQNLPEAMNYLLRETSRRIGERTNRLNHIYGGPYHWTIIREWRHLHIAYKYLYRNPVEAGLAEFVEEYPFSTLQLLLGKKHSLIPIKDPLEFADQPEELLFWMNYTWSSEQVEGVRKTLYKSEFKWPQNFSLRAPLDLGPEFEPKTRYKSPEIRTSDRQNEK